MASTPTARLVEWIEQQVSSRPGGTRLPPDRSLSRDFGLSKTTVERMLRRFVESGALVRHVGRGTFVAPLAAPVPADAPVGSVESTARSITGLVSSGALRIGDPLPPLKSIAIQFAVAPATARRALLLLSQRKLLARVGRTYFVGTDSSGALRAAHTGVICVLSARSSDFGELFGSDFLAHAYRKMEYDLSSYGASIMYSAIDALPSLYRRWQKARRFPSGILLARVRGSDFDQALPTLRRITQSRLVTPPRVVSDMVRGELAQLQDLGDVLSRGHISTIAAREVAHMLQRRRASRVLFFLDEQQYLWDYHGPLWVMVKLRAEIAGLASPPRCRFVVTSEREGPGAIEDVLNISRQRTAIAQRLGKHVALSPDVLAHETTFCTDPMRTILEYRNADVWVFGSSADAARALTAASEHRITVPAHTAILTLEDDPGRYHLGLSYCGPDFDRIGYLMAHALLGDLPLSYSSRGFVQAFCRMVHRQTT